MSGFTIYNYPKTGHQGCGLYLNMPFEEYLKLDALNASTLVHGFESMKRLKGAMDGKFGVESKEAELGSIVHALVEGQALELAVMPDYSKDPRNVDGKGNRSTSWATSWAKSMKAEFEHYNEDKTILSQSDFERVQGMFKALLDNPDAVETMRNSHQEIVAVAEFEGVLLKARLDGLKKDTSLFWDVKTTQSAAPAAFGRKAVNLSYPERVTFYSLVLELLGINADVRFVVVESSGVFDSAVYSFSNLLKEQFCEKVVNTIRTYRAAVDSDIWPGVSQGVSEIVIPNWAMQEEVEW